MGYLRPNRTVTPTNVRTGRPPRTSPPINIHMLIWQFATSVHNASVMVAIRGRGCRRLCTARAIATLCASQALNHTQWHQSLAAPRVLDDARNKYMFIGPRLADSTSLRLCAPQVAEASSVLRLVNCARTFSPVETINADFRQRVMQFAGGFRLKQPAVYVSHVSPDGVSDDTGLHNPLGTEHFVHFQRHRNFAFCFCCRCRVVDQHGLCRRQSGR